MRATVDFDDTALNVTVLTLRGFAAIPPVHVITAVPAGIPALPRLSVSVSEVDVFEVETIVPIVPAVHAMGAEAAIENTTDDAVSVMVSVGTRTSVMPMVKTMSERVSPERKLPPGIGGRIQAKELVVK